MTTMQGSDGPFLKHLSVHHTPHVIVTAEDEDFDDVSLQQVSSEGFNVQYVAMGKDNPRVYTEKLHGVANRMTGVSEHYAIVAFGDAAPTVLETHLHGSIRLKALIAYYPTSIPDPARHSFPMNTSVLVHLAGETVGVSRKPQILGLEGKRKTVRKRIDSGKGFGGNLGLSYDCYRYSDVKAGFAERDLDCFDAVAEELAWARTLGRLRESFGMKVDLETIRDRHANDASRNIGRALGATSAQAKVLFGPTMIGASSPKDLHRFYTDFFKPAPAELNPKLLSRTIGTNRVVDEIHLSFKHDREIHWLLPGIPATGKHVRIVIVNIVCVKGGLLAHERVYWDQASVLMQVGLLDYKNVPKKFKDKGVEELPVMGTESVESTLGMEKELNELIMDW